MRPVHLLLAVLVAAVWGVNFVVIEVGLGHFPPLLFSALRFLAAAVPAVFFVRRPAVAWKWIVAVGVVLGVLKFGLLFLGMEAGMPAGLSSLVLQSQAVFTALIAAAVLGERPGRRRWLGMGVALAGVAVAAADVGLSGTALGFALVVASAVFWGASNVLTRMARPGDALSFMVWVSLVPVAPLAVLSVLVDGPAAGAEALRGLGWTGLGAVAYVAWGATLFGFGVWGHLLRRYDASQVAPFSLLVPVFGMSSAALFLGEAVGPQRWLAALLLVGGVALTSLGGSRPATVVRVAGSGTAAGPVSRRPWRAAGRSRPAPRPSAAARPAPPDSDRTA